MSATWRSDAPPVRPAIGAAGWIRAVLRGIAVVAIVLLALLLHLALRLAEAVALGNRRRLSPASPHWAARAILAVIGLRRDVRGTPVAGRGAVAANHSSWLDIFVLYAGQRAFFVSKSEVADWPVAGFLVRQAGTVFIDRDPRKAREHTDIIARRIYAGQLLVIFPEGTSTDGQRVLPFKPTLFAPFFAPGLANLPIQPVSLRYRPPRGATDPRFHGWWGDMAFGPHLLQVLAAPRGGSVRIAYHPPLRAADVADRKALAAALEKAVRAGHEEAA